MSVPYPADTKSKPRSQNEDHLAGLASRYIEQNLHRKLYWYEVRDHLETHHGKTPSESGAGALMAILDLEWDGTIQYDVNDLIRRAGLPTDAKPAPLQEIADSVLALGWPRPDGKRSRKIYQCFEELGCRYRHCDIYWAMHEILKNKRLACHRAYWSLLDDTAILADPTLTVAERTELEQSIEADWCDKYVASLSHTVEREYLLDNRRADIFDRSRRLIIEAKAYSDDVVVLGAITQAMLYRTIANRDTDTVDRIAVLLPTEPSPLARQVARINELTADVIWWNGSTFRHEPFG